LIMVPGGQRGTENVCFHRMLEMIQSNDPDEVSFFAHAKGTSLEAVQQHDVGELSYWVESMYRNNLSDPEKVDEALRAHPCAGTLKYTIQNDDSWCYAGNFFWFNHGSLFTPGWKEEVGTSVGRYLRSRFPAEQAFNLGDDYAEKKKSLALVRNWDPSKVSVVTTCKNRWDFLKRSLPTWLNRGFKEIVIVDWSSDVDVASQVAQLPPGSNPVTVVRVEGEEIFNGGMARNTGARLVTNENLLFIDSDMVIKDWAMADAISLVPGRFYHGPHNIPPFGTSLVRVGDFRAVNGYSELYTAYGWEDNDLYNRLEASGLQRCLYDDRMVEHQEHDDELRSQHRDQKGRKLHETVWDNRKLETWTTNHRQTEKPYSKRVFHL